ncbi:hypothetical protein RASY3_17320 [Ruminococcus albus SY3]|uniref:Anti-sigma-W factor RsiW n=1 Tax=Ruminococcus albus SY3 TaxID=1341156 RepID=A0A011UDD9_RUMAL|nr:zf-HC2 domain-containing protein [Ruminococcus albus]EXM38644.1 hypothetical protein RASY3_17320 [Ruminococcus albus SY3]
MKCNVVRDLLASYCDGLLEEVTKREVEAHLTECEECRKLKESYTAELSAERTILEEKENINPFKKLKRKIKRIKVRAVVAILAASLMVIVAGVLTVGQVIKHERFPSWESIIQTIEVRRAAKNLISGDIEGFIKYLYKPEPIVNTYKYAFKPTGMSENSVPVVFYDEDDRVTKYITDLLKESFDKDIKGHSVFINKVDTCYEEYNSTGEKQLVSYVNVAMDDGLLEFEFYDMGNSKYDFISCKETGDEDDAHIADFSEMSDFEKDCCFLSWLDEDSEIKNLFSNKFNIYLRFEMTRPKDDIYSVEIVDNKICKTEISHSRYDDMFTALEEKGVEFGSVDTGLLWFDPDNGRFIKSWLVQLNYKDGSAFVRFSTEYSPDGNYVLTDTIDTVNKDVPQEILDDFYDILNYVSK